MDRTSVLQDLLGALSDLASIYDDILGVLKQQRGALLASDEPALLEAVSVLQAHLDRAGASDARRVRAVSELSALYTQKVCTNDVGALACMLREHGACEAADALSDSAERLLVAIKNTKQMNSVNAAIIRRRVAYGRFVSGLLSASDVYGADGSATTQKLSRVSLEA